MLRGIRDLAALLLPPRCPRCGGEPPAADPLCPPCLAALVRGGPAPAPAEGLDACVAAAAFDGEVAAWIRRFKYPAAGLAGLDAAAEAVARALILEASRRTPGSLPDAVVPVPLHPARLRARGFHPAANLARAVARQQRVPYAPDALRRVRDTPSQTGLGRAARRRSVADAFAAAPGARGRPGWRVWLVDDVVTTGATAAEAARALRRAGAARVLALAAARTPAAV